jgi:hypothetical protein
MSPGSRGAGESLVGSADRLRRFLSGLDRGEIISGRVVQVWASDASVVRVALGPGAFWARAVGGCPGLGPQRFEVIAPGGRPVLRLVPSEGEEQVDLLVDASREKRPHGMGGSVDCRA